MYLIYIETHKLYALKENDESKKKNIEQETNNN